MAAGLLRVLASPVRLAAVAGLSAAPRCVREFQEAYRAGGRDVSQPLFVRHLRVLRQAGPVTTTAAPPRSPAISPTGTPPATPSGIPGRTSHDHLHGRVCGHAVPCDGHVDHGHDGHRRAARDGRQTAAGAAVTGGSGALPRAPQERSTRQKRALAAILDASDGFRSAQDLFTELRTGGQNVGLTTVYNQLRALADSGEVDVLRAEDGETRYRRCGTGHHHHLVCRQCGRTVEVEGQEAERWAAQVAASHGFSDVTHTVEIVGTCGQCASGTPADA
ncbi:MAG TPA: transcriptional repressor [Streptosporangiaceae bacterium]